MAHTSLSIALYHEHICHLCLYCRVACGYIDMLHCCNGWKLYFMLADHMTLKGLIVDKSWYRYLMVGCLQVTH